MLCLLWPAEAADCCLLSPCAVIVINHSDLLVILSLTKVTCHYGVSKIYNRIPRTMVASSCPIEVLGIFWGGTSLGVSSLIALTSFAFTKTTFFRLSTKKLRNYLVRSTTWLTQHCTEHTEQHHHIHTTNNRTQLICTRIRTESQYIWNKRLLCDSLTFVLTFRVRV